MEFGHETFEAYFSGKLDSNDVINFTTTLAENAEIKKEYDLFLAAKRAASTIERDKMRAQLDGLSNSETQNSSPSKSTPLFLKLVRWGGSIAAIFLIGFFTYKTLQSPTKQDLFAQHFETYQVQSSRGGEVDALNEIYKKGDYDLFIDKTSKNSETPELKMMLANAYLKIDQVSLAISLLESISDETSLRDQKYWYLALCHLKLNNLQKAQSNLEKLTSFSNFKKPEVEKILSKITKK